MYHSYSNSSEWSFYDSESFKQEYERDAERFEFIQWIKKRCEL